MMNLFTKRIIFFGLSTAYVLYTSFVYTVGTVVSYPISGDAVMGRELFREKNCIACHQLYGLGGYMGPDLTNVISEKGSIYARAFIENGTEKMPDFNMTDTEVDKLISYLTYVDLTSQYPVRHFDVMWYGTVRKNGVQK